MSVRFGLFFVFCIGVNNANTLVKCKQDDTECKVSNQVFDDEPKSIMNVQSNVEITNERLNAMSEIMMQELTKLDAESKNTQEVTRALESRLEAAQKNVEKLDSLMNEVKQMKALLTETSTEVDKHSKDIGQLKETAKTVEELATKTDIPQQKSSNVEDIETRLTGIEAKMEEMLPSRDINEMKSALNLLQSQMISSFQQYHQQITNLVGTITVLETEIQTLKRSINQ